MSRTWANNNLGTLGAALTSTGTTITFAAAPSFPTLTSGEYIVLVLDPPTSTPNANFEIAYLTAYTAGATTGTISRGQDGTTAVAHASGASWLSGPVASDFAPNPNVAPYTVRSLLAPPIGLWPLQDVSGTSLANVINSGAPLTATSSGITYSVAGPPAEVSGGNAIATDGSSGIINNALAGPTLYCVWLNPAATTGNIYYAVIGDTSGGAGLTVSSGNYSLNIFNVIVATTSIPVTIGTWIRAALYAGPDGALLGINGSVVASSLSAATPAGMGLTLGGLYTGTTFSYFSSASFSRAVQYSALFGGGAEQLVYSDYVAHTTA